MVFSYYLNKLPYKALWHVLKNTRLSPKLAAYCDNPMDYEILKAVVKHLPPTTFLAKNQNVATFFNEQKIPFRRLPVYPQTVLMARHAAYKFPEGRIKKIGFRHGAYHFKQFIKAESYNAFDVFFMSSQHDNVVAKKHGITSGVPIGYPKLDAAFDGTWTPEKLEHFSQQLNFDPSKKTILFTATWEKSGMSAVGKWINQLNKYSEKYNIFVTLHPFMTSKHEHQLLTNPAINYIKSPDIIPYMLLADVLVGDYSSILADFCALDKPLVTFKIPPAPRSVPAVTELISTFTLQIDSEHELQHAIEHCLNHPDELSSFRKTANDLFFYKLDGQAGKRAADYIKDMLNINQDF